MILEFARKHANLAKNQEWVKKRMNELAQSPHKHHGKKVRAFARICDKKLPSDGC